MKIDDRSPAAATTQLRWLSVAQFLCNAFERRRQRSLLITLDDRALQDLAISRADALQEWSQP
ncbi:MAG: DUF1127 domain-containing protein, partial [Geminicoccaceae bacterium]